MTEVDRSTYLSRFTADHITHLCELNHIDTNAVKTKQERIASLCALPKLIEDEPEPRGTGGGVGVDDLFQVMKRLEESHQLETEKLCKSILNATIGSQSGPSLKGLHQLSSDDDIVCYLSTFERLALAAGKPKGEWPRLLEPYLTGRAQQAFHALSAQEQDDYDSVVQAIRRRYHLTPEAYRIKFKSENKRANETFEEFANKLQDYFLKWIEIPQKMVEIPDVCKGLNLVMIDQFLERVSDEVLRLKLREFQATSLIALARKADELVIQRGANTCMYSPPSGGDPPTRRRAGASSASTGRKSYNGACFHCGQLGHRIANCPVLPGLSPQPVASPGVSQEQSPKCNFIADTKGSVTTADVVIQGLEDRVVRTRALLDSGSEVSLVTSALCEELGVSVTCQPKGVLGMINETELVPEGLASLQVGLGGSTASVLFRVVHRLPVPVLLGVDFAEKVKLVIDFGNNSFSTGGKGANEQPVRFSLNGGQGISQVQEEIEGHLHAKEEMTKLTLSELDRQRLDQVFEDFSDVFSEVPGRTDVTTHRIDVGEAHPIRSHPYKVSPEKRQALDEELDRLLDLGKIEPSDSPWAAPVVMVPKKNGKYRMCVDYRKLNTVTKVDAFPMPTVDDILSSLHGASVFSSLDLRSGYWQVRVADEDVEKTAFVCHRGLFQFKVLPFGVVNGPATFQRLMSKVLDGLIGQNCYVYLDDIVCFSPDIEQHISDLQEIFCRLRQAGLTVNAEKCQFACQEMKYLGHVVSSDGLKMDPEKVSTIVDYPQPRSVKELERFLGMVGWYQKFIPGFSDIAAPLHRLKKKGVAWDWTADCTLAFQTLKERLLSEPILGYPDEESRFAVHTDASNVGIGAVLTQQQQSGIRTIAYASRSLSTAERNYSTTEKECLAVVWALEKWRPYLEGRDCRVVTDHQALCWLFRKKKQNGRLARWILRLQDFRFQVIYRPGQQHHVPDALSRIPEGHVAPIVGVVSEVLPNQDNARGDCCAASGCIVPDDELVDWIQCDDCDQWYHQACVHIDSREAENVDRYSCPLCVEEATEEVVPPLEVTKDSLVKEQRNDPKLSLVIQMLERQKNAKVVDSKRVSAFSLKGRILYKDGCVVIPKVLQNSVLVECHCKPRAGHLGRRKTLKKLKSLGIWWDGMSQSVRSFIRSCKVCLETKPTYRRRQGKMLSTTSSRPWEKVGVDLMGPLPKSYVGHEYILVAVDHFSKFVEILPLKTANSQSVATTLVRELFCRYGPPETLLSDNGPQFRGKVLKAVCAEWGIQQVFITPYHPQTNWVERVNRNIKAMLQAFTGADHRQWDIHLAELAFALNSSTHDTLGVEPSVVMFGRRLAAPLTNRLHIEGNQNIPTKEEIENNRQQAVKNSKRNYNKSRDECHVKVGDEVMVKTYPLSNASRNFSAKLAPRWTGPFVVQEQLTPVNFRLKNVVNGTVTRVAHADQLKKC